jgi:hypothetical protein
MIIEFSNADVKVLKYALGEADNALRRISAFSVDAEKNTREIAEGIRRLSVAVGMAELGQPMPGGAFAGMQVHVAVIRDHFDAGDFDHARGNVQHLLELLAEAVPGLRPARK